MKIAFAIRNNRLELMILLALFAARAVGGLEAPTPLYELKCTLKDPLNPRTNPNIISGEALTFSDESYTAIQCTGPKFKGLALKLEDKLKPDEGTIDFYVKPFFSRNVAGEGHYTTYPLLSAGPGKGKECLWVGLNYHDQQYEIWMHAKDPSSGERVGILVPIDYTGPSWYHIMAAWRDNEIILSVGGSIAQREIGGKLQLGERIEIGGSPDLKADARIREFKVYGQCLVSKGQARNLEISNRKPGVNDVTQLDDLRERFSFLYESQDKPSKVTIRPNVFKIEAGGKYWITSSQLPPFQAQAEKQGMLELALPQMDYCAMSITAGENPNLVKNGSFEEQQNRGLRDWNPESYDGKSETYDSGYLGKMTDNVPEDAASMESNAFHTGQSCLKLTKQSARGVLCVSQSGIPVTPGCEYLLIGHYQMPKAPFGSILRFSAILSSQVKKSLFSDQMLNPAVATRSGEWLQSRVKFTVPKDAKDPTVKLVVGLEGGSNCVYWDDISLQRFVPGRGQGPKELASSQLPAKQTADIIASWKDRKPYTPEVRRVNGRALLYINGKPCSVLGLNPSPSQWPRLAPHKQFGEAGVHLHWMPVNLGGSNSGLAPQTWLGDGKYDFSGIDERIAGVLSLDPEARIMCYLWSEPYPEFGEVHPDGAWRAPDGKRTVGDKYNWKARETREPTEYFNCSYTSEIYRRETGRAIRAFAEHLANSPVGKTVIGAHLIGGTDGQFFNPIWPEHTFDYSEDNRKEFCRYLKQIYHDDVEAFRKAWQDPGITFETAQIPSDSERYTQDVLLDPSSGKVRRVIDASNYEGVGVAETVIGLAGEFKAGLGRPCIVITYYPDLVSGSRDKNALELIVNSRELDGIASVPDYGQWRLPGRTASCSSLMGTLKLHNKLFFYEMDHRDDYSYLSQWGADFDMRTAGMGTRHSEDLNNQIRRDFGMVAASGYGAYLYAMVGNNFINDKYMDAVREANEISLRVSNSPVDEDGQMAVFVDEHFSSYLNKGINYLILGACVRHARLPLYRSGLSWDGFLLSDVSHPQRKKYKLNVFLTAAGPTETEIEWIEKNLQRDGNINVFCYDAGRMAPGGFEKNIGRLTGIRVKLDKRQVRYRQRPSDSSDALSQSLSDYYEVESYGQTFGPLFHVDDPSATPLAHLDDNSVVVSAIKRHKNWTAVYIGIPGGITPAFLRALAKEAGIKPVGPENDVTFAGNGMIVVHAVEDGEKTISWSKKSNLLDLSSNKIVVRKAKAFTFKMKAGETRWFRKVSG